MAQSVASRTDAVRGSLASRILWCRMAGSAGTYCSGTKRPPAALEIFECHKRWALTDVVNVLLVRHPGHTYAAVIERLGIVIERVRDAPDGSET